ncbi:YhdP family protein [Halomonas halocynthiae]|uniref:YhdP family phospholipid transporter n=1 Tax=Halomonas halocynthiae TaxID=176290 RepID=UPI000420070A|nr:AsmA-like C-terminal region-containing protein [Halomonas halocynthiae]
MVVARGIFRWALTLLAVSLALLAVLLSVVRLAVGQAAWLEPRLEALLSERLSAEVSIGELSGSLQGMDLSLSLQNLRITSQGSGNSKPLFDIEQVYLRLDTLATLVQSMPVLSHARVSGATLHLYQAEDLSWYWPDSPVIDDFLARDSDADLTELDDWTVALLRQRLWGDRLAVVLHGQQRSLSLQVPKLLISGDKSDIRLEGSLELVEQGVEQQQGDAFQVAMQVVPGTKGLADFSAGLQANMNLESLAVVLRALGLEEILALNDVTGSARLWARWKQGRLEDARLDVQVPSLVLSQPQAVANRKAQPLILKQASLLGQWSRNAHNDGWRAWFTGNAADQNSEASDEAAVDVTTGKGLPMPRYWFASSRDNGWWLNGSAFELDALASWYDRLPLPEALSRTLDALMPRGMVNGMGVGYLDGQWQAQVSATQVSVSPWDDVPGGGPLDIWLEARGARGDVRFINSESSVSGATKARLELPRLFDAPLPLDHASGQVSWVYEGPRSSVSGMDLTARMQGATVEGTFGLVAGSEGNTERGGFGLRLAMQNIDAVDQPLESWLPMKLLRKETDATFAEWLRTGVQARVPKGALTLHLPLDKEGDFEDDDVGAMYRLDLTVRDGSVLYEPKWPRINNISGQLSLRNETLEARIDRAQGLGVVVSSGEVALLDKVLSVTASLDASLDAVLRYLAAMPVEGMTLAEDWQGVGNIDGQLALRLPISQPDDLNLSLAAQLAIERVTHKATGLTLQHLHGPLRWQQSRAGSGLAGELDAHALGGPVKASIDTAKDRLTFSGRSAVSELLALGAPAGAEQIVAGEMPWQASVHVANTPVSLLFESGLDGVAINLPEPLGKPEMAVRPLSLNLSLGDAPSVSGRLGMDAGLRWRSDGEEAGSSRGQLWLMRDAPDSWPSQPGWSVAGYLPELVLSEWASALSPLMAKSDGASIRSEADVGLSALAFDTDCLRINASCLGSLGISGQPKGQGWQLALDGSLLSGRLDYQPSAELAVDLSLKRLALDSLIPDGASGSKGKLLDQIYVPPTPEALPEWVGGLPNGRLRVAELSRLGRQFGPLTVYWNSSPGNMSIGPVGLTLGEVSLNGMMAWEAAGPEASLTRMRGTLNGRNLGDALSLLGEEPPLTSAGVQASSQLAWPGAPWQFALARSQGSIQAKLRDGRFLTLGSPSARLVGLLNVDNLIRRLRLDFSDVTGRGTAFNSVTGAATLYGGVLDTREPIRIQGPAANITLSGTVDLIRHQMDQQLTIVLPFSRSLSLAAVVAGAPVIGGALFVADMVLGDMIDRVTQLNYRVRGPWTAPQISLERAE